MLLGPIFRVELVSIARLSRYFFLRFLYGIVILFVMWVACEEVADLYSYNQSGSNIQRYSRAAAAFFGSYTGLQMLAILALGPALAVGTISTERERRTIEYLFTTDLGNHEIILGKLAGRLALLVQLVLVGLPILFIFRLLGGIPANLLVASFLFAGSTALLLASLGVCISVWSARVRDATIRVYVVLAALLILPGIFRAILTSKYLAHPIFQDYAVPVLDTLLILNPFVALGSVMINSSAMGFGLDMGAVFKALAYQVLFSVGLILLAIFAVRRVHLRESFRGTRPASSKRAFTWPRWRPTLGNRPVMWKEMFAGSAKMKLGAAGTIASALIILTIGGFACDAFYESMRRPYRDEFFEVLAVIIGIVGSGTLLLLGGRAASLFTEEKERDTWLSLMATPLTGREIITGKVMGNIYGLRWAYFVLFACCALGLFLQPEFIVTLALLGGVLGLLSWFVTSVGLSFSLHSKTTTRSMAYTLGTLIFLGGGYMFCCCVLGGLFSGGSEILLAACIPFLVFFPVLAYDHFETSYEEGYIPAFVIGTIGYFIATLVIHGYMVDQFERLAGRGAGSSGPMEPTRSEVIGS